VRRRRLTLHCAPLIRSPLCHFNRNPRHALTRPRRQKRRMTHAPPLPRLALAAFAAHAADQLVLAAIPLFAAVTLGLGAAELGALVAAQSAAWLVVSLPAGAWTDRMPRRALMVRGLGVAALGFAAAWAAARVGLVPGLAFASFVATAGVVAFALAAFAAVPAHAGTTKLQVANAKLELARAVATLGAAPLAGWLAAAAPDAGFALAALLAAGGALLARALPPDAAPGGTRPPLVQAVREGAAFVAREKLLRAVALCAIFWNTGFFALMAGFVPHALALGLSAQGVGLALGAYGAGLVLGALSTGFAAQKFRPGTLLLFGPAASALGIALVLAATLSPLLLLSAGMFLFGYGPMLWQVTQTALRQVVAPPALLGRVGATLQVAVFGVRPLGALAGGGASAAFGTAAAPALAALLFAASLAAVLASPLPRLRTLAPAAA
jgi:predicted MFS family arabinose efflux permease